jgi:5-methylcytosine-specific restriction endonuclease McrA
VAQSICEWSDECLEMPRGAYRLCRAHIRSARWRGTLDSYRPLDHRCRECGEPFPPTAPVVRIFCSKRCSGAATRRKIPAEVQRAYARASRDRHVARELAARADRTCAECHAPLDPTLRRNRRFCSRRCINTRSLREKKDQRRENHHRYRSRRRELAAPGVTERDWKRLLARHDGRCAYCGSSGRITVDHILPLSRGGMHSIGNVLPACFSCNASKRDRLLIIWRHRVLRHRLAAA